MAIRYTPVEVPTIRPQQQDQNPLLQAMARMRMSAQPQPNALAEGMPEYQPAPAAPSASGAAPATDIDRAMSSISRIESGGRYDLQGPVTRSGDRAYGRYQVMGANVGPWTERHYGRRLSPQEFLADQAAQDAVFRGEFGSYLSRYGNPQDAASMWFTGRPYAQGRTRSDAIPGVHPGLTGEQYVNRFIAGL
jgi:hypothetical protein